MATHIENAKIVTPEAVIAGGLIADVGLFQEMGSVQHAVTAENFDGDYLIPGLVDLHTDNLERHYFPRPNVDWDPGSAAIIHDGQCTSVGVTTVFDSMSVGSWSGNEARQVENMTRLIDGVQTASDNGMLCADHRIHWRCETTNPFLQDLFEQLAPHPKTSLLSVMDHTPGQRQYPDVEKHFNRWREHLGLSEADVRKRFEELKSNQAEHAPSNRAFVARRAKEMGLSLASHDDQTVEHVDEAKAHGATLSEFPTTLDAAKRSRERDMVVIMGGPNLMRGGSYSGNVSAGEVAQAGLLDVFASDYVPRSMVEAAFKLVDAPYNWDLPQAINTVSANPAACVGLDDRGRVEPGKRADFVRVKLVDGRPIVRGVWVAGERVG